MCALTFNRPLYLHCSVILATITHGIYLVIWLVHTKTGEVVHIDFGIVFEQGKVCGNECHVSICISLITHVNVLTPQTDIDYT